MKTKADNKTVSRSIEDRIQKIAEGVYVMRPRNPQSRAIPRAYAGVCRESGRKFVLYTTQVLREGKWVDPVVDLHPEVLRERLAAREALIANVPDEVMSAWRA